MRVGNSLALIIDLSLQKLLGIDATTLVEVSTDGVRLTIEPSGGVVKKTARLEPWDAPRFMQISRATSSDERRIEYNAPAIIRELGQRGIEYEHMLQLHHRYWPLDMYREAFSRPMHLDEHDRDDLRRLESCLASLRDGCSWEQAIEQALHEVPVREVVPCFFYQRYAQRRRAEQSVRMAASPVVDRRGSLGS